MLRDIRCQYVNHRSAIVSQPREVVKQPLGIISYLHNPTIRVQIYEIIDIWQNCNEESVIKAMFLLPNMSHLGFLFIRL
jgi:hypothetical protein